MNKQSVALLSLGIMGSGMTQNLLANGFQLPVYNRNPVRREVFRGRTRIAETPTAAAKEADLVIAMVSDDEASRSLWLGDGGALNAARPGAVAIECSTISLPWGRELAAAAGKVSVGFVDAPVFGSKTQAAERTLRFLAGGEARDIELVRPALSAMGSKIVELGGEGSF
jgi:3-hydroxyisobutyrate dehydrogenase